MDFINMIAILTLCRLNGFLNKRKMDKAHGKLSRFALKFENLPIDFFNDYPEDNMDNASVSKKRYYYLLSLMDEKYRNTAETLMGLSLLYALYPEVREGFREAGITVSINTAYLLENNESGPVSYGLELYEALYHLFLPFPKESEWYGEISFKADRRLVSFLLGNDDFSVNLKEIITLFKKDSKLSELFLYQDVLKKLLQILNEKDYVLQLRGDEKCGKKFLIKHIAKGLGKSVLFVDFQMFSDLKSNIEIENSVSLIVREALFYNSFVCWHNVKKENFNQNQWSIKKFSAFCVDIFLKYNIKVFCCTEKALELPYCCVYDFNEISQNERIILWKQFCCEYNQEDIDPVQFAIRYKFSCGQIGEVFKRRKLYTNIKEESEKQIFEKICVQIAAPSEELFHILRSDYKLSDLMLPEREIDTIKEICNNFKYYYKVYTKWDMQSKMQYGIYNSVFSSKC